MTSPNEQQTQLNNPPSQQSAPQYNPSQSFQYTGYNRLNKFPEMKRKDPTRKLQKDISKLKEELDKLRPKAPKDVKFLPPPPIPEDELGITDRKTIEAAIKKYLQQPTLQDKEDELREFLVHGAGAKYHKKSLPDLLAIYANKATSKEDKAELDETIGKLEHLLNPLANIRTQYLKSVDDRMTWQDKEADKKNANAALMNWDIAKVGSVEEVDKALQVAKKIFETWKANDEASVNKVTMRKLKELLALDDFSSILGLIAPKLIEHGVPLLEKLWTKHVKPKLQKIMGGDEGLVIQDQSENPLKPQAIRYEPGFNKEVPGVVAPFRTSDFSAVSPHHIKSVLHPEAYVHRQSTKFPQKTALASVPQTFTISVNASGNAGVFVYGTAALDQIGYFVLNDATFSPKTGVQTPTGTAQVGAFSHFVDAVAKFRVVGFSLQVIPVVSYNSAGSVSMGYWQNTSNTGIAPVGTGGSPIAVTANAICTEDQLTSAPYFIYGNSKRNYRMISIPSDFTADTFYTPYATLTYTNQFTDVFYVLLSGFTASTVAARFVITPVYDFVPKQAYAAICPVSTAQTGPMTNEFIAGMASQYPLVQTLTLTDVSMITNGLPSETTPFKHMYEELSRKLEKVRPVEVGPITVAENNYVQEPEKDLSALFSIE